MARVAIVAGLLALAFTVYSLIDCALTERSRIRALPRAVWLLLVVALPVLGGALWFLVGTGRIARAPLMRYRGPDDDPDFIRGTSKPAPAPVADDDEWRRLEEELAALDTEPDPDDDGDTRRR